MDDRDLVVDLNNGVEIYMHRFFETECTPYRGWIAATVQYKDKVRSDTSFPADTPVKLLCGWLLDAERRITDWYDRPFSVQWMDFDNTLYICVHGTGIVVIREKEIKYCVFREAGGQAIIRYHAKIDSGVTVSDVFQVLDRIPELNAIRIDS